jgi:hypothetical protein
MPRGTEPEHIDFKPDDRAAVIARMDGLASTGAGWINLSPALDEDQELPTRSATFGIFSGRGPDVPLCTWVPGTPAQIGVQHGAGTKASPLLRDLGNPVPQGWRVTQDHPRRGLVVLLPPDVGNEDALEWLIRAGTGLSAHLKLAGWWRAGIYTG